MISPEKAKLIDPKLNNLPEEEVIRITRSLYELGHLIFDDWLDKKAGSKYPDWVLHKFKESNKIETWTNQNKKRV